MTGKNHVKSGVASIAILIAGGVLLGKFIPDSRVVLVWLWNYLTDNGSLAVLAAPVMFLLGCLLPDADSNKSIIGKRIHFPFKHRTWMHSLWPVLLFAGIGVYWRPMTWLALGYFIHLFWDNLGRAGVCWFYPKPGFREYANGAMVKHGHWAKLYRNNQRSETALVWLIVAVALGMSIGALIA